MRIGITAPIYINNDQHVKYLNLTTNSLYSKDHDLQWFPVENWIAPQYRPLPYAFTHNTDKIEIIKAKEYQSVASAWNLGIEAAKDCDYVLVINTDIVLKSNAIDRLVAFAESRPDAVMWTMSETIELALLEECDEDENVSEHPHFSCFMVKPDFFKHVGGFDENFIPAYCEDADMHARLALAGKTALIYGGAKFFHFGSRTIKEDTQAWMSNGQTFPKNQQYFLEKWGHPVVNDVDEMREKYYKTPFNEPNRGLDYWR